jgi:MinD superfamily P-loop ATPase
VDVKIRVDADKCSRCGTCYDVCSEMAVDLTGKHSVITGNCTGCGVCIILCPSRAMYRIKKQEKIDEKNM